MTLLKAIKASMTRIKTISKLLIVCSLMLSLTACGFKLRGEYPLPDELKTLYLSSVDVHGELTRKVKQHLLNNHIEVKKSFSTDLPELRILKDTLNRRTLSLFENGQVAEYELIYTVKYQLIIKDKEPQSFEFNLHRDYQEDPDRALAKSRELNLMLSEMRREAAHRILRNMSSIKV